MGWPDWSRLPVRIDANRVAAYVVAVVIVWWVAGRLKRAGRLRSGDARKVNHVCALAGGAVWFGWLPADVARGSFLAAGLVLFALLGVVCGLRGRAPFALLFQGHARESDAPYEDTHVWASWLLAVYGLALADLLFGMTVMRTAALLLGVGDAAGEPVGARLGRLRYPVPAPWGGGRRVRTLEGSAAVFAGSLVVALSCSWDGAPATLAGRLAAAAAVALTVALVEAVSPHGADNFTIPVAAGGVVWLLSSRGLL
jgi:dolichol kinase